MWKVDNINTDQSKQLLKDFATKVNVPWAADLKLNTLPNISEAIQKIENMFEWGLLRRWALEWSQLRWTVWPNDINRLISEISSGNEAWNSWSNSSSSNVNFKVNISWILEWLNQDVQLQKLPNNKYNTDPSNHGYLAENIQKLKTNWIFEMFDNATLQKDLLKYFDANWQFISWWGQTWWKFPWETTPNP
jgi:hypothetical protein